MNINWKGYPLPIALAVCLCIASTGNTIAANIGWFVMLIIGLLGFLVLIVPTEGKTIKRSPGTWIVHVFNVLIAAAMVWYFVAGIYAVSILLVTGWHMANREKAQAARTTE